MQKITPFLWFDHQAEEAAKFYTSIFQNSSIGQIAYYDENGPGAPGSVMTIDFFLDGQQFTALNGGPEFAFTPALSLYIHCKTQEEVDHLWARLTEGGSEQPCGWLVDKYGVSWQVVPDVLIEMLDDPDKEKAGRVLRAMLQMTKIDISALQRAYAGLASAAV